MSNRDDMLAAFELVPEVTKHRPRGWFNEGGAIEAACLTHVIRSMEEHWPLTVRAWYYQLVSRHMIPNNAASYEKISNVLSKLRRLEIVPWRAVEDRTRVTTPYRGWWQAENYIKSEMRTFLDPEMYNRRLIQDQYVYVEITVEKDALMPLIEDAADPFITTLVTTSKGQISASMLHAMAERFKTQVENGREPILLHFGDLDPTGVQIPLSMRKGMQKWHDVDVDVRMVGLTPEQVVEYDLPQDGAASIKKTDSNYKAFIKRFPNQAATELDALPPNIIKQLVKEALEDVYDMDVVKQQRGVEKKEKKQLKKMRKNAVKYLTKTYPEVMADIT